MCHDELTSVDLSSVERAAKEVAMRPSDGGLVLVKQNSWTAVPVESGYHFDTVDQERILRAARDVGTQRLYAFMLEQLQNAPAACNIPLSPVGIEAFNREFGHFNVALVGDDIRWIVACTTDDYFVVAGLPQFVGGCVGGDLARAYDLFNEFATSNEWDVAHRTMLVSVLNGLKTDYATAPAGASIVVGSNTA